MDSQLDYWDTTGVTKTFGHPIEWAWLDGLPRYARILDYGCGYGRAVVELSARGFQDLVGVDFAPSMIERARRAVPDAEFEVLLAPPETLFDNRSFAVVMMFALLTCVPAEEEQRAIVAEAARLLAPGGMLYISDLVLQDDARNRARYAAYSDGPYGTFVTDDGAICRHHEPDHLRGLLDGFRLVNEREIDVQTMNGNPVRAMQLLARRSAA